MTRHRMPLLLTTLATIACTDSTAPESTHTDRPTLSLPEYASQLRADPFLRNVSEMLGRPELATAIDASLGAINQPGQAMPTNALRVAYDLSPGADTTVVLTETDLLQAVLAVTMDRIAQVSDDSAATNPPPTR